MTNVLFLSREEGRVYNAYCTGCPQRRVPMTQIRRGKRRRLVMRSILVAQQVNGRIEARVVRAYQVAARCETRYDRFGSDFFDRKCEPINVMTWARLRDSAYRYLVPDTVIEGAIVTTQWLGDDHEDMFCYPPRMYGTAVIRGRRIDERGRYTSEEEAIADHWRIADEVLAEERSEVCQIPMTFTTN